MESPITINNKVKRASQLGIGSATIEQMLGMDLDTLMAMSDNEMLAYIQPALTAVPPVTSRSLVVKPVMRVKSVLGQGGNGGSEPTIIERRRAAKKPGNESILDVLRKAGKVKTYEERKAELQKLKDMLGDEEGLAEAESKSVGSATMLMVRGGDDNGAERKARLKAAVVTPGVKPSQDVIMEL